MKQGSVAERTRGDRTVRYGAVQPRNPASVAPGPADGEPDRTHPGLGTQGIEQGRVHPYRSGAVEVEHAVGGLALARYLQVQAQRLSIRLDLRAPGALQQFESVLKSHAGTTPVLIEATTTSGIGRLSINGGRGLRVDAALPGLLRSLPGVQLVNMQLGKPWAQ